MNETPIINDLKIRMERDERMRDRQRSEYYYLSREICGFLVGLELITTREQYSSICRRLHHRLEGKTYDMSMG